MCFYSKGWKLISFKTFDLVIKLYHQVKYLSFLKKVQQLLNKVNVILRQFKQ